MGGNLSTSINSTDIANKAITEVIISNNSKCSSTATAKQSVEISDTSGDVNIEGGTMDSRINLNLKCLQDSTNDTELLDEIKEKIESEAKAKLDGLNLGLNATNSQNLTKIVNDFTTKVNLSNIKDCLSNISSEQSLKVTNTDGSVTIKNLTMRAVLESVTECLQSDFNTTKAVRKLENDIKNVADSSVLGIINSSTFTIIAVVVVVVLLFFIKKKGDQQGGFYPYPMPQPPYRMY